MNEQIGRLVQGKTKKQSRERERERERERVGTYRKAIPTT